MTTEKDKQRVSSAYREIADQTTRPEIDARILELAASGVRSRYGSARAWIRPLAWAATIALSLALVLEFTRDLEAPVPAVQEEMLEERARSDADFSTSKEEKDLQPGAAKRMPVARPEVAAPASLGVDNRAPLREAEEQARMRSSDAPTLELRDEAAAPLGNTVGESEPAWCDDTARATPASWYACIEDLVERGLDEEAARELDALRQRYPDFEEALE